MTEVINVQISCFVSDHFHKDSLNINYKGINFHLEINNFMDSKLNLLNENSLKVFMFQPLIDRHDNYYQDMLNTVKSKVLIVEFAFGNKPSLENLAVYGHHMFFKNEGSKKIYNNEEFLNTLLEMSLENEVVLESSVVNNIFSHFLNKGRVEQNVIRNFCIEKEIDFSKSITILKHSNNVFEYSNAYYFIYKKCLEFTNKIHTFGENLKNGLATYEELQTVFDEDVDIALKFLEDKNIIIKNKNNYAYIYTSGTTFSALDAYRKEHFSFFEKYIPNVPKNINLILSLNENVKPQFFQEISKNREISSISKFQIFIDGNTFIVFNDHDLKIYFCREYDLDIIISILSLLKINRVEMGIKNEYKIGQDEIEYYFEEGFDEEFYNSYLKYYSDEIEDVKSIIKAIYLLITGN